MGEAKYYHVIKALHRMDKANTTYVQSSGSMMHHSLTSAGTGTDLITIKDR